MERDTYSLYLLDETISQSTFLDSLAAGNDTRAVPVIQGSWRPPLIFQRDDNGAKWFIDVGQPYEVLADWRVHTAAESRPLCTITFHPAAQNPIELLPKSVRTLADKLNEALGPENDEGEPHPTSRLRVVTQHVLANAALRPWALSDNDAYNSRTEVDDGLASWAQANRKRQRLHREMLRVYPVAERSLAAYYARTFGLPQPKAQEVAAWALDLIFRSYFVFSNGAHYFRYDGVRTNPWPMNP